MARFGQTAVLWRRGRDVVSRTAADEPPSARLAGPETGASLGFLYEELRERKHKMQSGPDRTRGPVLYGRRSDSGMWPVPCRNVGLSGLKKPLTT